MTWSCDKVRIRTQDTLSAPLTFSSEANRIVVLGATLELMHASAGLRAPAAGIMHVLGETPALALARGITALARMDATVSATESIASYVRMSSKLAGHAAAAVETLTGDALERFGLGAFSNAAPRTQLPHIQLATRLAAAYATGAELLIFDDPTPGLPDDIARAFAKQIIAAFSRKKWLLFAGRMHAQHPLWMEAEEALIFRGDTLLTHASTSEIARVRCVSVTVAPAASAFAESLSREGVRVAASQHDTWVVELPKGETTALLFRIAERAGASVIDLAPLLDHEPA